VLRELDPRAVFASSCATSNDPGRRYILNFSPRARCFGRGGGHHSPIAGYLADEGTWCSCSTVNRKYGPWLVSSERLYQAMSNASIVARKKKNAAYS